MKSVRSAAGVAGSGGLTLLVGITWRVRFVVGGVGPVVSLFSKLFRRRVKRSPAPEDHLMVSLVLLLEEHFELEESLFARQLDEIFPGSFLPKNEDCIVKEVEEGWQMMVKSLVP